MTKEELDRKIKSFSENNGLGKTYNYYEVTETGHSKLPLSSHSQIRLKEIKIKFRTLNKTAILLAVVLTGVVLLSVKIFPMGGVWMSLLGRGVFVFLLGWSAINRLEKQKPDRKLVINSDLISFNKDVFKWSAVETAFLKKDQRKDGKLLFLWLGIMLKNGDAYFYDIPLTYAKKTVSGNLKLEEILLTYREQAIHL